MIQEDWSLHNKFTFRIRPSMMLIKAKNKESELKLPGLSKVDSAVSISSDHKTEVTWAVSPVKVARKRSPISISWT